MRRASLFGDRHESWERERELGLGVASVRHPRLNRAVELFRDAIIVNAPDNPPARGEATRGTSPWPTPWRAPISAPPAISRRPERCAHRSTPDARNGT